MENKEANPGSKEVILEKKIDKPIDANSIAGMIWDKSLS